MAGTQAIADHSAQQPAVRIAIALLCGAAGAAEQWLFGQMPGAIILDGLGLSIAFVLVSPRAAGWASHLKVAALLGGLAFAGDLFSLAATSLIDGRASLTGGTWMAGMIVTWVILNRPRVSKWAELRLAGEGSH